MLSIIIPLILLQSGFRPAHGTIFGIRIVDSPPPRDQTPQYKPSYRRPPNIVDGIAGLKAGALRAGGNALRFKGDVLYGGADTLDQTANQFSPNRNSAQLFRPPQQQTSQQLNFGSNQQTSYNNPPSYNSPSYNNPSYTQEVNNNNPLPNVIKINNAPGGFGGPRESDVIVGDPRRLPNPNVDKGLLEQMMQAEQMMKIQEQKMKVIQEKLNLQEKRMNMKTDLMKVRDTNNGFTRIQQCDEHFTQLVGDIFIGNEMVPDVIDSPPLYPLELTYRTVRTFPGMRLTAETTRFKPMVNWPAEDGALYTLVLSNLDINTRENRTLAEFWHWFVANIPGDSVDNGDVIFDLLFPLVLPEGDGDHRFGYFVMKQPRALDYADEGGPTDSCSPNMSEGRGPRRSVKELMRKYNLELTASTFLVIDTDQASLEIACEWQRCMGGQVFVSNLDCIKK